MENEKKYLELNFVKEAAGRGVNSQVIMEELGDGTFRLTEGRVGIKIGRLKPKNFVYPMDLWEDTLNKKINRGYLVTKTKKMEKKEVKKEGMSFNGKTYATIKDEGVREIFERLSSFANSVVQTNFTIKVDDISPEMLELGKKVLDELATGYENMSVAEFNAKLKVLYAAIPRRIDNLSKFLANRKAQFNDLVAEEQDLYDIMAAQVRNEATLTGKDDILDSFGLEWRCTTPEEDQMLTKMLGSESQRFVRAWRIKNRRTEKAFDEYCKKEKLSETKGISHLFHGSRNENFFSILTNGLTINPTGVVITGKAYGNGTYFAPQAVKSMGYTSRSGSKWANGSSSTGFLGVYKVATGNRYNGRLGCDSGLNYSKLQQIQPGAHCTWAERRYSGFQMDEVIVYQDEQSTVEFLIEIGL